MKPHPLQTYIVKVFELCNLNCSYCYMYNLEDVSYLRRPKLMEDVVRDAFLEKVDQHVREHDLEGIVIIFHGGEPLLAGRAYIDDFCNKARSTIAESCEVIFQVQTNGILVDDAWIDLCAKHLIRIGVSLDGPKPYNDLVRVYRTGQGSYDETVAGIRKILNHPKAETVFGSVLSVANPDIPATEFWNCWAQLGVPRFDLLLPMYTHDKPPPFSDETLTKWLIDLFQLWWQTNDRRIDIRFFRNIINLIVGSENSTDYLGGKQHGIVVVDTDGSIQPTDALRACADGMVEIGLSVTNDTFDDAMRHPFMMFGNYSASKLHTTCESCAAKEVCGGGYLPHRYSSSRQFDNVSVYCKSLFAIIEHVYSCVTQEFAVAGIKESR